MQLSDRLIDMNKGFLYDQSGTLLLEMNFTQIPKYMEHNGRIVAGVFRVTNSQEEAIARSLVRQEVRYKGPVRDGKRQYVKCLAMILNMSDKDFMNYKIESMRGVSSIQWIDSLNS